MKYSSSNKPLVCMQTQSTCYKGTHKMAVKGILWHSTGANNPNLKRYIQPSDTKPPADTYSKSKWLEVLGKNPYNNDWNHTDRQAGLNCWIGKLADGTVTTVQTMPWDFRPWGCGSGSKGSCNDGWIQFEICEDSLSDKNYFEKVYKEACEITAYLCQLFDIDPKGFVVVNGVQTPTILCHKDASNLKLGSNHGDVLHWFKKYNKTMENVRNDVTALLKTSNVTTKKLYRVRKSKNDTASQKGAFSSLVNAKECCQAAGAGYHVFDWDWKIVYSYTAPVATLSSITVTKLPAKTTYTIGESYNGDGLTVTAAYSDKTTKVVTGYNVSGFTSAKAGKITMTVALENKSTTFNLTIKEKEVVVEPEKVTAVYDLNYSEKTKIIDKNIKRTNIDCAKIIRRILTNNSTFDVEIAKAFFKLAPKYRIDPMMAIAQSILETGWFNYTGSAVTAEHHNYCGLGVTATGKTGATFSSIEDGVTAQLQHLFAYGCKEPLPDGDALVDPRFDLVIRGVAPFWQQLAGRWAYPGYDTKTYSTPQKAMEAGNTYGQKILSIFNTLTDTSITEDELEKYFPTDIEVTEPTPDVKEPSTEEKEPVDTQPENQGPTEETTDQKQEQATSIVTLILNFFKKLAQGFMKLFNRGK